MHLPFRVLNPDNKESYNFMIKAGHPLIQFFPIKRKESYGKLPVRDLTDNDIKDYIQVSSSQVKKPQFVRYAWSDTASATLFNEEGFPASSFSSE